MVCDPGYQCVPRTLVAVPAGTFMMGCPSNHEFHCDVEMLPYHQVTLDSYEIDKYEVTQAAYEMCVDAGHCQVPSEEWDPNGHPDYPVVGVNWQQAREYCGWAGMRLCTEAEWENAARGTDDRRFPWGNEMADCNYAAICGMQPVGSKPAGASPYGVLDMAGNALEWVEDWYSWSYYSDQCSSGCVNPQGPAEGIHRSQRGGWFACSPMDVRAFSRGADPPEDSGNYTGFRCCR